MISHCLGKGYIKRLSPFFVIQDFRSGRHDRNERITTYRVELEGERSQNSGSKVALLSGVWSGCGAVSFMGGPAQRQQARLLFTQVFIHSPFQLEALNERQVLEIEIVV